MFKRNPLLLLTERCLRDREPRVVKDGVETLTVAFESQLGEATPTGALAQFLASLLLAARESDATEMRLSFTRGTVSCQKHGTVLDIESPRADTVIDMCRQLFRELRPIAQAPRVVSMRLPSGPLELTFRLVDTPDDVCLVVTGFDVRVAESDS